MPLDASAFPHLLDLILSYASPEALLPVRATSRDFHARADKRLFEHITIMRTRHIAAVTPVGASLRFEWREAYAPSLFDARDPPAHERLRQYIEHRMQAAPVLDVPDGSGLDSHFLRYFMGTREAGNVPMYRTLLAGDVITVAGDRGTITLRDGFPVLVGFRGAVQHPCCRRELVVHLLDGARRYHSGFKMGMPKHVTIVGGAQACRRAMGLAPDAGSDKLEAAFHDPAKRASYDDIIRAISSSPQAPYPPSTLSDKTLPSMALINLLNRDEDDLGCSWNSPCSKGITHVETVRFLSPEAYAAEVGAVQVALETKDNPYVGPPATYLP
jgi:hypothetical protein